MPLECFLCITTSIQVIAITGVRTTSSISAIPATPGITLDVLTALEGVAGTLLVIETVLMNVMKCVRWLVRDVILMMV